MRSINNKAATGPVVTRAMVVILDPVVLCYTCAEFAKIHLLKLEKERLKGGERLKDKEKEKLKEMAKGKAIGKEKEKAKGYGKRKG